jgi:hypothetical protein
MAKPKDYHDGGQEPSPDEQDRPEQNIGYDEAVKGRPLTPHEREIAERESEASRKHQH